jgi:hypothetical protein
MKRALSLVVGASVLAVSAMISPLSHAAAIDIIAQLNPGQSGPVYAWSLYLRTDPGYEVGAIDMMVSGFTSYAYNPANLGIDPLLTSLNTDPSIDPYGLGRGGFITNNRANGVAISAAGGGLSLLGTFYGPSRTAPPVVLYDGEYEYGGTVFGTYLDPLPIGDVSLDAFPRALIALTAVPEPSALGLLAVLTAGTALRRRAGSRARSLR